MTLNNICAIDKRDLNVKKWTPFCLLVSILAYSPFKDFLFESVFRKEILCCSCLPNITRPVAEFKEFKRRFKFKPRFKYG